jgi:prevent-host-death family protein
LHSGEGVEKPVSAADANRKFSKLLRAVRKGQRYVVMFHGKGIAKIVPDGKDDGVWCGARAALLKRLRSERVVIVGRWRRDDMAGSPEGGRPDTEVGTHKPCYITKTFPRHKPVA